MKTVRMIFNDVMKYGIRSLLIKYFVCIVLTIMIPTIVISSCIYGFYNSLTVRETVEEKKDNLEMKKKITEVFFENAMISIQEISRDEKILNFIKKTEYNTGMVYEKYDMVGILSDKISEVAAANQMISEITVYSTLNNISFSYSGGFEKNKFPEKMNFENNKFELTMSPYKDGKNSYVLICNRVEDEKDKPIGMITIYINAAELRNYIAENTRYHDLYITDSSGNIIFSINDAAMGKSIKQFEIYDESLENRGKVVYDCKPGRESYKIIKTSNTYNSRNYISVISNDAFLEKTREILSFLLMALLLVFILSMIVATVLSIRLYMPIHEIVKAIGKTDKLNVDMTERAIENEMYYIMSHLDFSAKETEELKKQINEKAALLNRANSKVLQMQINPHFIYNALEAVNWRIIALSGFNNEASNMIKSLAGMMRYALETEHSIVTIEEELENIKSYLGFQKIRFKDKIQVHYQLSGNIRQYSIIKLSLQPIVENIFSHGIKGINYMGEIYISAEEEENNIRFDIKDNGKGIDDETAAQIKERLKNDYVMAEEQIGIANVNQRIKLIFGEKYGITLTSYEKGNTVFSVTIPKIKQK